MGRRRALALATAAATPLPWMKGAAAATSGVGNDSAANATPSQAALEKKAPSLPAVGSALVVPPIELLDGSRFDPADTIGKPLLIYWWASTCPFCAVQSPFMDAFWKSHHANTDLRMIALSVDKSPQPAVEYLKKKGYGFPAAWASPDFQALFPKPRGLPITIMRGRDGRVAQAEMGQLFEEDVQEMSRWLG